MRADAASIIATGLVLVLSALAILIFAFVVGGLPADPALADLPRVSARSAADEREASDVQLPPPRAGARTHNWM